MSGLGGTGAEIKNEIVALMPAVHRFAMRFERSVTDADDLTQDTVLKALAHIDQFRPGTSVKSWLFTIARNTYCTKYKIRQRFTLCADMEVATSGQAVQSTQEWSLRTGEVDKAISALDPDKRKKDQADGAEDDCPDQLETEGGACLRRRRDEAGFEEATDAGNDAEGDLQELLHALGIPLSISDLACRSASSMRSAAGRSPFEAAAAAACSSG
nr:RNA polymerase sigma factor [Rhizobium leguminosarum]